MAKRLFTIASNGAATFDPAYGSGNLFLANGSLFLYVDDGATASRLGLYNAGSWTAIGSSTGGYTGAFGTSSGQIYRYYSEGDPSFSLQLWNGAIWVNQIVAGPEVYSPVEYLGDIYFLNAASSEIRRFVPGSGVSTAFLALVGMPKANLRVHNGHLCVFSNTGTLAYAETGVQVAVAAGVYSGNALYGPGPSIYTGGDLYMFNGTFGTDIIGGGDLWRLTGAAWASLAPYTAAPYVGTPFLLDGLISAWNNVGDTDFRVRSWNGVSAMTVITPTNLGSPFYAGLQGATRANVGVWTNTFSGAVRNNLIGLEAAPSAVSNFFPFMGAG